MLPVFVVVVLLPRLHGGGRLVLVDGDGGLFLPIPSSVMLVVLLVGGGGLLFLEQEREQEIPKERNQQPLQTTVPREGDHHH